MGEVQIIILIKSDINVVCDLVVKLHLSLFSKQTMFECSTDKYFSELSLVMIWGYFSVA